MIRSIRILVAGFAPMVVATCLAACLATPTGPTGLFTPTPTACATVVPSAFGTAAAPTALSGQTNPATVLPFPPTVSPEMAATQLARTGNANPGAPTTASGVAPCWTPTPVR